MWSFILIFIAIDILNKWMKNRMSRSDRIKETTAEFNYTTLILSSYDCIVYKCNKSLIQTNESLKFLI